MLFCTSLVMLMTPGLAFFYGGLVGRKNVVTIMMQSFISIGVTTVLWITVGYSLSFSGDVAGVIGNLDMAFLKDSRNRKQTAATCLEIWTWPSLRASPQATSFLNK